MNAIICSSAHKVMCLIEELDRGFDHHFISESLIDSYKEECQDYLFPLFWWIGETLKGSSHVEAVFLEIDHPERFAISISVNRGDYFSIVASNKGVFTIEDDFGRRKDFLLPELKQVLTEFDKTPSLSVIFTQQKESA